MKAFHSLAPISEVYSTQSIYVQNKIKYQGLLKRDSGLLSLWHPKYFQIKIISFEQMDLFISKSKESLPQEILSLREIKLTKKCSEIEGYPCFGIVVGSKKYLVSLKNIHQCQKFHAQITYIKKLTKELFYNICQSRREASLMSNSNPKEPQMKFKSHFSSSHEQSTKPNSDELEENEEAELLKKRNMAKLKRDKQLMPSQEEPCQDVCESFLAEVSSSICLDNQSQIESNYLTFFTDKQNEILQNNKNFIPYPTLGRLKMLVNNQNVVKAMVILNTSANLHHCLKQLLAFSTWNTQIPKMHILDSNEEGYIVYLQFAKNLAANQGRCAIAFVDYRCSSYCSVLRVKSVERENYQFMNSKKEIHIELVAKALIDRSNKRQKIMIICLTIKPKDQQELAIKFMKEISSFQSRLNN